MRKLVFLFLAAILISGTIDLDNLFPYADQVIPEYIVKDNTDDNEITDIGATLGRVLFYDKNLSVNNTVSCASCHQQRFAFGDTSTLSRGLDGGLTGRHSMRLVNARFSNELRFFWDERAATLEDQTTKPIQDHVEMGYSGQEGSPDINDLIDKLTAIEHYPILFNKAFGGKSITEEQISEALAQFVRSIQSFDSKFDEGMAMVNNINPPFPNFTADENAGKRIFIQTVDNGGAACQGCHRAPEFDIDRNSRNNGVIGVAGAPGEIDLTNTRAPSLRDVFNPSGGTNGPFMHNGALRTMRQVINHYNEIEFDPKINPLLDNRLRGGAGESGQNLNLLETEKDQLIAFLRTLTGSHIYTAEEYSDPFDEDGNLDLIGLSTSISSTNEKQILIYPNPTSDYFNIEGIDDLSEIRIINMHGQEVLSKQFSNGSHIDISKLSNGVYQIVIIENDKISATKQLVKN